METRRNWQAGLLALLLLWLALPGLALAQEAGWDAQKAHIATLIRNGDPTSLDQAQPLLFDQLIPKATALFGPTSDREWKAEILAAQWHRKMGQFDEAEARLVAAIERAHALAYSGQELMNLYIEICGIFSHLANQGHTDKWQDYALYAPTVIDLSNRPENRFEAALNMVVASQGDQQDLEYWLRKARGMLHQISQPEQLSLFYRMEGQHLLGLGAWPAAERSLSLADSCYQLLDKRFALEHIDCLVMLADAKLSLGRPEGVPALVGRARVLMDTDGMLTAQMKDRRVLFGGFLLQNEAEYHMREGRFEVALPLLWTSFEELKAAKSRYAATSLILIQECHMGLGQWHMADSMADSVPTWKAFSDPNSQAAMLLNMALIDAHFGRVSQAARQFALMDSISGENFGKALRELDEVVSHSLRDRPFRRQNAFFFDFASRHPELGFDSLLYDRELLHKSALVQNERALRQYIENHPDTTIRQHWRKMKESEAKDARWYQEQLSSRLVDAPGNLGFSPVGWRQVRQALGPRQAAIEFVEVPTVRGLQPTDTTRLAALLLRPGQQPRLIPLCMGHELDEAFEPADQASVYRADSEDPELFPNDLHALIWEPIAPFLEGVDTVFYAPAGRLHSVNLGAMPTPQGGRLWDGLHLERLGSTRSLVVRKPQLLWKGDASAVVFAAIDYGAAAPSDDLARAGFAPLPATAREEQALRGLLPGLRSYTAQQASEEAFAVLSGQAPRLLHMATHGYFKPELDDPMLNSGLVLAGANRSGNPRSDDPADGLLTAAEVAQLNLEGCELAVLSACQTGRGSIDMAEGVYGLQRAFFLAGAQRLLVSLWQVPDAETAQLMGLFYQNWSRGGTPGQALVLAQKEMARLYPENPEKWAGFVLVE